MMSCFVDRLAQGVPTKRILSGKRRAVENDLARRHLTTRRDIQNIRQSFGITTGSVNGIQTDVIDSVSVGSWVQEMG